MRIALALLLLVNSCISALAAEPSIEYILDAYYERPELQKVFEDRLFIMSNTYAWANRVLALRDGPQKGPLYCINQGHTGKQLLEMIHESYFELPNMTGMTLAPALLMTMRHRFPCVPQG